MLNDNQVIKWVLLTILILLVLPLIGMIAMMSIGAVSGAGMMSRMGGMIGGGGMMSIGAGSMAFGLLWMVLVAAALIFLIVLLVRSATRA